MERRVEAIQIRNVISSYNPGTMYSIEGDNLRLTIPGGVLTPEQRELARANKALLMELFTTPPDVEPQCYHGNDSKWILNQNGVWVCPCLYACQPSRIDGDNPPAASKSVRLAKHWLERAS